MFTVYAYLLLLWI